MPGILKEINKLYLEEYVLRQLKKLVFNEKKMPSLVRRLNKYLEEQSKVQNQEATILQEKLGKLNVKINNIINAVENGMPQASFTDRLNEMENEKVSLENRLGSISSNIKTPKVTEEEIMFAIKRVRGFINNNNLPECKQFISDFVEKVDVYKEHIELVLKTGFNIVNGSVEMHKADKKLVYKEGLSKSS